MEKLKFENMFREIIKTIEQHYPELLKEFKLKSKENKRWRAESGEKYFFTSETGKVYRDKEDYTESDNDRYDRGVHFRTEDEAILYDKKQVITQEVKDIAIRLGEPTKDDWNNSNLPKYCLAFDFDDNEIILNFNTQYKQLRNIYCLDNSFLSVCIDEIGVEDLRLILL